MAAAAGVPLAEASRIANAAAGIVVGMAGTAVAESEALARIIDGQSSQATSKVLSPAALAARIADARSRGSSVVFTSGTFDSLSVSDLRALQRARSQGELLVVGVNGDSATSRHRAELLAALRVVDYVTVYSERSPAALIRQLRPDVVV